ncbi:hypothetical protein F5X97DRAFT_290053 [Nemania serpens]|nr:hypothetical protein F5X97DRAFT_290053 [Nemania serpens]
MDCSGVSGGSRQLIRDPRLHYLHCLTTAGLPNNMCCLNGGNPNILGQAQLCLPIRSWWLFRSRRLQLLLLLSSLSCYHCYRCYHRHCCPCRRRCRRCRRCYGCCWLLLIAVGCCWLLLVVVGCCWLLLLAHQATRIGLPLPALLHSCAPACTPTLLCLSRYLVVILSADLPVMPMVPWT